MRSCVKGSPAAGFLGAPLKRQGMVRNREMEMAGKRERRYIRKLEKEKLLAEQERLQAEADLKYMKEAIKQAKKALALSEVPIGCVIVHDGKVIARGYNRRNTEKSVLAHAEISAIKKAAKKLGDWRLEECTLYVTLEPCQMCAGAIVQARIPRVVMGCMNPKAGCAGSVVNLLQMKEFNHRAEVCGDVCAEECSGLLSSFFRQMRLKDHS